MKNTFRVRYQSEFVSLLTEFYDTVREASSRSDVCEQCQTRLATLADTAPDVLISAWYDTMATPLLRQHAKYVRAISSVTNHTPILYHAIRYRDVRAVMACANPVAPLDIGVCTEGLTPDESGVFWTYMNELCEKCFRWKGVDPPPVPTAEELAQDIEKRRTQRPNSSDPPVPVKGLSNGVDDLWTQLCAKRGTPVPIQDDHRKRIREYVRAHATDSSEELLRAFPELGTDEYTPEHMDIVDRIRSIVAMDDAIPSNMMRGIENMAGKLVRDLNNGRCDLNSLDIEGIGKQVIQNVSDQDMETFASNLSTIIPALARAQRGQR